MQEAVKSINCSEIRRFKEQPRQFFEPEALKSLRESIGKYGQEKPGEVMPLKKGDSHRYELVSGERRWLCCAALGIPFKTTIRTDIADTKSQFLASFAANGGQENLTDLEVIRSVARIKQDFGFTNKEVAERIGRPEGWVEERAKLAKLEPEILELMSPKRKEKGLRILTYSHAKLLSAGSIPAHMRARIAEAAVRDNVSTAEIRNLLRRDSSIEAKPGYEYAKLATLARNLLKDSAALREKGGNLNRVFRSRPTREITNMMERIELAVGNLSAFKDALGSFLKTRKSDAA